MSNKEAESGANETVIDPLTFEDVQKIVNELEKLDPDNPLRKAILIQRSPTDQEAPGELEESEDSPHQSDQI